MYLSFQKMQNSAFFHDEFDIVISWLISIFGTIILSIDMLVFKATFFIPLVTLLHFRHP